VKKLSSIRYQSLENGVWVATESLPHVRSVSMGVYLDTGSRDETPDINGLSHFFEHMVFKGTQRLNPLDIVRRFEATGGQVNAYTSKEQTCFYGKVVDIEMESALDALLDMVLAAKFDPVDIEKEKEVVIEEIHSVDDSPDELVYELFSRAAHGTHALARPIAGTAKTVRGLTRDMLVRHREAARMRVPVVVVAVGHVDHDAFVAQVRRRYKLTSKKSASSAPRPFLERKPAEFHARHLLRSKDVQQASVILGGPGYAWHSPQRFPLLLLHCVLGDGMSSKLFQNLRETHGLVYSIFSNPEFLAREGLFNVGFATDSKNLEKAVREILRELARLRKQGLTARELDFAKENVTGGILLGLESTSTRMGALARRLLGGDPEQTLEQVITRLQAVTRADVLRCAQEVLRPGTWASAAVLPKGVKVDFAKMLAKN
jgi:predicted Zn-dependent peptidase